MIALCEWQNLFSNFCINTLLMFRVKQSNFKEMQLRRMKIISFNYISAARIVFWNLRDIFHG